MRTGENFQDISIDGLKYLCAARNAFPWPIYVDIGILVLMLYVTLEFWHSGTHAEMSFEYYLLTLPFDPSLYCLFTENTFSVYLDFL